MTIVTTRREPRLVTIIRRLTDLEAAAFLNPAEMGELNQLRLELEDGWPEVSAALASAYLQALAEDDRHG